MNDQERLFAQKVAYFEYSIPFIVTDEKKVRAFYEAWAADRELAVDMSVQKITDTDNLIAKVFARDLRLRIDVADKTPDEIYEIYVALRSLDWKEALTNEDLRA